MKIHTTVLRFLSLNNRQQYGDMVHCSALYFTLVVKNRCPHFIGIMRVGARRVGKGCLALKEWGLGWEKLSCLESCPQFRSVLIERGPLTVH